MLILDNVDLTSVQSCLKQLQPLLDEARYSEASKLCHKCLKKWPGENSFYRVKAFCEIQLSRWHSCLQTIGWLHGYRVHPSIANSKTTESDNDSVKESIKEGVKIHYNNDICCWLHFEQSYCYYKLGKYKLGLKTLLMCYNNLPPQDLLKSSHGHGSVNQNKVNEEELYEKSDLGSIIFNDKKLTLLLAQLCLRIGNFKEASDIYSKLKLKGAESLLSINRLSVDLSLSSQYSKDNELLTSLVKKIDDHIVERHDPYELYFNYACAFVLLDDVIRAQDYLDIANEMLENELKQEGADLDPEEQVEFANILAFRAYLNFKRSNFELAKSINTNLIKTFINSLDVDQATVLVSLNNQLFFGYLHIHNYHLARLIRDNELYRVEPAEVTSMVRKIENLIKKEQIYRKFSDSELRMIHGNCIWACLSSGNLKEAHRYLENFNRSLHQKDLLLYKAALMCVEGKYTKSISLLRQAITQFGDHRFVLSLTKLLIKQIKYKDALSLLQQNQSQYQEYNEYYKEYHQLYVKLCILLGLTNEVVSVLNNYINNPKSGCDEVVRTGCNYLENNGHHEDVVKICNYLYQRDKTDLSAKLGIVYNQTFLNESFIEMDEQFSNNAEELENEYKITYNIGEEENVGKSKARRRNKRRNKKPKNIVGNPDPERWLHKHERYLHYSAFSSPTGNKPRGGRICQEVPHKDQPQLILLNQLQAQLQPHPAMLRGKVKWLDDSSHFYSILTNYTLKLAINHLMSIKFSLKMLLMQSS
ncbi:uncharacterized protein TA19310 [Theileria annulata]|uniref:Signal recognition particle subunit SRP72 n=1 Tax=Theileria annulata TaxID=5874 RepID=Q4UGD5_THEAN|nr:uncharacterized protein TA19310 [Theileria annulata]CAI73854.1 hypothetical protein TA19310 [Theileria annulata]|eukprot:XP_954531.1 hypothetical protein TA19310 [Theileria annulata]